MAKLTNPLTSEDARGSVSGIQFSRNRYGNFGSRKSTSTRAQAPNAIAYRAALGPAHHAFDALTPAQKDSWNITPDTHVTPRQHFLSLYLRRAARSLSQFTTRPQDHGPPHFLSLQVTRFPAPNPRISAFWLNIGEPHGYLDFTTRSCSIRSYFGHPRKFRHQIWALWQYEGRGWDLQPYGRYCTLQISSLDYNTLRLYGRWVYRFDDDTLVDVKPDPP